MRHHRPGERAGRLRKPVREQGEQRRSEIDEAHPGDGAGEAQRRIAQFGKGGTRHHPPEIAEAGIGAQAIDVLGQAEPDRALPLHQRGQRAIVDQGAAHRLEAAGRARAPRAAPACSRRPPRPCADWIVHPGEGIEHLEEEHEGGREPALGRALAAQLHHQRREDAIRSRGRSRRGGRAHAANRRCRRR